LASTGEARVLVGVVVGTATVGVEVTVAVGAPFFPTFTAVDVGVTTTGVSVAVTTIVTTGDVWGVAVGVGVAVLVPSRLKVNCVVHPA
jgi:hypothetical protein